VRQRTIDPAPSTIALLDIDIARITMLTHHNIMKESLQDEQ
jgi:hypothetical protein